MFGVSWQKLLRLPQTYFLFVGAILGYITFLIWVGIRWVPLVVGGIIVLKILEYSGVRIYPIAYGDVNIKELEAIAALRESTVKTGTPENVQDLLKGLFQTNL